MRLGSIAALWACALAACGTDSPGPAARAESARADGMDGTRARLETGATAVPKVHMEPAPTPAPTPAARSVMGARGATEAAAGDGDDILEGDRFIGTEHSLDGLAETLRTAAMSSLQPVGSTSTVFRARMPGPEEAAFKACTKRRPRGPASEVAAYRMARLLGLTNVPPAVSRSLPLAYLHDRLQPDARSRWPEIAQRLEVRGGVVEGAAIHWVPRLSHLDVDRPAGMKRWKAWLRHDGEIPSESRSLAASVSTMIAFDYLIGNWDRWSGGNAKGHESGRYLYFRDHDVAFPARLQPRMHRRMIDRLLVVERFSRRFYERLKALTREHFEAELAKDPAGAQLLSDGQIAQAFDRRRAILSHVGALIEEHGADRVLVFP